MLAAVAGVMLFASCTTTEEIAYISDATRDSAMAISGQSNIPFAVRLCMTIGWSSAVSLMSISAPSNPALPAAVTPDIEFSGYLPPS